jgi:hypothetical protein
MSLPASQAAGRLFLQLLDTVPIRAEEVYVNLPAGAATGGSEACGARKPGFAPTQSAKRARLVVQMG